MSGSTAWVLAGDIGATHTRLGIFMLQDKPQDKPQDELQGELQDKSGLEMLSFDDQPSASSNGLEPLIAAFLKQSLPKLQGAGLEPLPRAACFGVAGPVKEGAVRTTNLPWVVDEKRLALSLNKVPVRLMNDLQAWALGLESLKPEEVEEVYAGSGRSKTVSAQAVLAPGSGLGEALLFWDGQRYQVWPSEGGHCDFSPQDDLQIQLWKKLQLKYGHVSYERILSGPGIADVYQFIGDTQPSSVDAAEVVRRAVLGEALALQSLDLFIRVLGAEAGNLALKVLAHGGIYLGGGILPKLGALFVRPVFMASFLAKGRLSDVVAQMPVRLVLAEDTALRGAAAHARSLINGSRRALS